LHLRSNLSGLDDFPAAAALVDLQRLLGGETAAGVKQITQAAAPVLLPFCERIHFLDADFMIGRCQGVPRQQNRQG
jgi:hypothetical protein